MSSPKPRSRTDLTTFILHWGLVVTLVVSLLTGFRVAADVKEPGLAATFIHLFDGVGFSQGAVIWLHVVGSVILLALTVGYIVFLTRARLAARVSLRGRVAALSAPDSRTRRSALNVIVYWIAFALLAVAGLTGLVIYLAPDLLPYAALTTVHRVAAWGVLLYVTLHVAAQFWLGGVRQLLKIFTPKLAYGMAGAVAVAASAAATAGVMALDTATMRTLRIAKVTPAEAPVVDGRVDATAWVKAQAIRIHTVRGINLPGGEVDVTVRAVHDGTTGYFLFEWDDSTRSLKHLPLRKEEGGWRVLHTHYDIQDEDVFYEDKFGVMLSRSSEIAGGGSTHLGPQPISDRPGSPNRRGLHYTTDGSFVDAWHWKAARTGLPCGQMDDNYFGPPMEPTAEMVAGKARYTGGYTKDPEQGGKDPEQGGGYVQNWKGSETGLVTPQYLPRSLDQLRMMQPIDLDPNVSDWGQWWLWIDDTEPYSAEAVARIPVGTIIPSVVLKGCLTADRGEVRGMATWADGKWRLEVSRTLDTGSQYDVPIATDTYLWVATFDHSQARHSQHLHPVRIQLGE